jgi:hypothetical protein
MIRGWWRYLTGRTTGYDRTPWWVSWRIGDFLFFGSLVLFGIFYIVVLIRLYL